MGNYFKFESYLLISDNEDACLWESFVEIQYWETTQKTFPVCVQAYVSYRDILSLTPLNDDLDNHSRYLL